MKVKRHCADVLDIERQKTRAVGVLSRLCGAVRDVAVPALAATIALACAPDVHDASVAPSCPGDPACYTGVSGDACGIAVDKYCGSDDDTGLIYVCTYSDGACGAIDGHNGVCLGPVPPLQSSACDGTTIGCDGVVYKTECQADRLGHTAFSTREDLPCDTYPAPPRDCGLGPQTYRPCEYCGGRPVQACRTLSNGLKQIICEAE
jgi:hypothetical protein